MRLPKVRLTIRRLMILIAVIAVGTFGCMEYRRCSKAAAEFQRKAVYHTRLETLSREQVALSENGEELSNLAAETGEQEEAEANLEMQNATDPKRKESYRKLAAYNKERRDYWVRMAEYRRGMTKKYRKVADYHSSLAKTYGYAASHPWVSVPPEPPEPSDPLLDGDLFNEPEAPEMRFDF